MTDDSILMTLAVLGGTGKEGRGLATRWAKAGYRILIGSRVAEKAQATASELTEENGGNVSIEGATNENAVQRADIAILTVPYLAHRQTLESVKSGLKGKILIDVTVPLVPPKITQVQMPPAGSAAQEAREILGKDVEIVSAFQNISYEHLISDKAIECDVLVCGTSKAARGEALKLVEAAGLTGWDAGALENSVVVEGMTSVLIGINKQYGSTSAGIQITGIQRERL